MRLLVLATTTARAARFGRVLAPVGLLGGASLLFAGIAGAQGQMRDDGATYADAATRAQDIANGAEFTEAEVEKYWREMGGELTEKELEQERN